MRVASDKLFSYALWIIVLVALVPRLLLGAHQFIHYDGYWHVFIATQDRWALFFSEWRKDAHPLLFYLLLRYVARLGHSHLVYRSICIFPGVGSVFLIGQIARRLLRSRIIALLAAAAFGFSITMIDMSCDVRGYPLALFLVLCAFLFFLDLFVDFSQARINRALLWFGIFSSLAISTEYYAVFFWLACLIAVLVCALRYPAFREAVVKRLAANRRSALGSIALVLCIVAALYFTHVRYQPTTENNVSQFYFQAGDSLLRFLSSGLRSDLNYFLPVEIASTAAMIALFLSGLFLLFYLVFLHSGNERQVAATTPALIFFLLLSELILLSLVRRYPFGGYVRQQSILFPFLLLTGFVILDRSVGLFRNFSIRNTLLITVAILIAVNFSYRWRKFPKISEELFTREYNTFRTNLSRAEIVYVDQFSLIAYYIHTYSWKWQFTKHVPGNEKVDAYLTTSPSGEQQMILRNKDEWNFDLLDPKFYFVLADSLRTAQVKSANLFFLKQMAKPDRASVDSDVQTIRDQAARFQLAADPIVYRNTEAYATFRLK
ncbi:MAG: phospholipid carrier-dependent glycosyltransferase [Acidobacteriaceae bacterium]|nr:phospholipid carrier-dependent glycosyltransferase [Acidobacteriaceae bacterium]MBV9778888.1 phospholipid carrier-dependent glycosyltransferase [Acidobacteriaceae bacterium]